MRNIKRKVAESIFRAGISVAEKTADTKIPSGLLIIYQPKVPKKLMSKR